MADTDDDVPFQVSNLTITADLSFSKKKQKRRRSSAVRPQNSITQSPLIKQKKRKNTVPPAISIENPELRKKFTLLRDLTLFALSASDECPDSVKITNRGLIERVVTILIPCLPVETFGISSYIPSILSVDRIPKNLDFLQREFDNLYITTAPGNKYSLYPTMNAFIQKPLTKKEKKTLTDKLKNEKVTIPKLRLTLEQLSDNQYPIHPDTVGITPDTLKPLASGWVDTIEFEHDGSHTFAMDCEMCETANGKVLTRFSLIDFNGETVFDELVKPEDEITDYLTKYSGITEDHLKDVTVTLTDIQEMFLKRISSTDYIIGHSLENDLNVLKIRHPNIVDTSLIFEHPRGPPFKSSLKYITSKHLDRTIQEGSHDSIEDSKCCLDLVKLKLIEGGLLGKSIGNISVSENIRKVDKKCSIIDYGRVQANQNTYIQCLDDDQVVDSIVDSINNSEFIIGNLRDFEQPNNTDEKIVNQLFVKLNERLTKIYESVPNNTLLIISSGHGDLTEFNRLKLRKDMFGKEYSEKMESSTSWTADDEKELNKLLEQAKLGVTFLKVKSNDESSSNAEAVTE